MSESQIDDVNISTEKLSPGQVRLIEQLLLGLSISKAAKVIGIGEATAYRWLRQSEFQLVYQRAKQEIFDNTVRNIINGINDSRNTLTSIMKDPHSTNTQKAKCAMALMDAALKSGEILIGGMSN